MTRISSTWKLAVLAGLTMLSWSAFFAMTYGYSFYWDDLHFIRAYSLAELLSTFHGPNDPDRIETMALRPIATLLFCFQGTIFGGTWFSNGYSWQYSWEDSFGWSDFCSAKLVFPFVMSL